MKYKTKVGIFGLFCFVMAIYFLIQLLEFDMIMYTILLPTIAIFWIAGWESINVMDRLNNNNEESKVI